jgi:hypothetical protein
MCVLHALQVTRRDEYIRLSTWRSVLVRRKVKARVPLPPPEEQQGQQEQQQQQGL